MPPGLDLFLIRFSLSLLFLLLNCLLTYIIIYWVSKNKLRRLLLAINWLPLLVLPLAVPYDFRLFRLMMVLAAGFLVTRSLDFLSPQPPFPEKPPFHRFFFYTYFALALNYPDPGMAQRPRDFTGLFLIFRGTLMSAFVVVLMAVNTCLQTPETAFWLNLFCKMAEWYLLFVGFMDVYYGIGKLFRIEGRVNLRDPILSRSPADFWFNRWNLPIIDYLQRFIFIPSGAINHPYRSTFLTFLASGLLHEYGFDLASETVKGYVLAFFLIQGMAVIIVRAVKRPFRRRLPRFYRVWNRHPLAQAFQITANIAFFVLTGSLFFRAVDLVFDFHRIGFIISLCEQIVY